MPDITPTSSSEKITEPVQPVKQRHGKEEENPPNTETCESNGGSSEPIDAKYLEQVEKDLANHTQQLEKNPPKKFTEEDFKQIKQDLANLHKLPPEQLQALLEQLKKNLSQLQIVLTELKKQKKIDPEQVDFILSGIAEFASKDLQKFTQEDMQKLRNTLVASEEKVTQQVTNKQIEPQTGNILLLFLAFAKAQMDQNDKAMIAGINQTKVKTSQLELQAEKQKDIAKQSTEGIHVNTTYAICWSIFGAVLGAAFAFLTGGVSLALAGAAIGGVIAGASVGITAAVAKHNPDAGGLGGITDKGPDAVKTMNLQTMLAYFNTEVQKLSSQLGSTEKLLVEDTSTKSSQIGQQAGDAIREMGEIMKSR